MRNDTIPKTLQKWIDDNPEKVADAYMEADGCGEWYHPYSFWLHLTPEYFCPTMECRTIHEVTVKEAMDKLDDVVSVVDYIAECRDRGYPLTEGDARYMGIDPALLKQQASLF